MRRRVTPATCIICLLFYYITIKNTLRRISSQHFRSLSLGHRSFAIHFYVEQFRYIIKAEDRTMERKCSWGFGQPNPYTYTSHRRETFHFIPLRGKSHFYLSVLGQQSVLSSFDMITFKYITWLNELMKRGCFFPKLNLRFFFLKKRLKVLGEFHVENFPLIASKWRTMYCFKSYTLKCS